MSSVLKVLARSGAYMLAGRQFNGLMQGAYYGDKQPATHYPIVRLKSQASGGVVYARTVNPNTMSIAPGTASSVSVMIPATAQTGSTELSVIANGIASRPVVVDVVTRRAAAGYFGLT